MSEHVLANSSQTSQKNYPLLIQLRGSAQGIEEVTVNSRFIDTVELSLEIPEVCLAQRPGLGEGQFVELIPDI